MLLYIFVLTLLSYFVISNIDILGQVAFFHQHKFIYDVVGAIFRRQLASLNALNKNIVTNFKGLFTNVIVHLF